MKMMQPQPTIDPLAAFMAGLLEGRDAHPIPLISTSIDVEIASGLAVVTARHVFCNAEDAPIEALMTFPVPVGSVLFSLEAQIDGRVLKARAERREQARATYETAVDAGKAAVLHEEVLRGVHTLSAANIRPGAEIEVTLRWTASLTHLAGRGFLRIPLTAGDIYGCSGLEDADDLVHSRDALRLGTLRVSCLDGDVTIAGIDPGDIEQAGAYPIPLDRPVDISAPLRADASLLGTAADDRRVTLEISPAAGEEGACRLAVVADCSGSMGEQFGSNTNGNAWSKHEATLTIVRDLAAAFGDGEQLDLWQFDDEAEHVGDLAQFDGSAIDALLSQMSGPRGGTEIGRSLQSVMRQSELRDILLITDGKSYSLDVQTLAMQGRRISVLLIGEDSLEANVGHLASLTGGEMFIATTANLETITEALLSAMRRTWVPALRVSGPLEAITTRRGGMDLSARWTEAAPGREDEPLIARAVGAFAAALALSSLDETRAGQLAEAEGLITHLTSLVLVDDEGLTVDRLPGLRKVSLQSPRGVFGRANFSMKSSSSRDTDRMARKASSSPQPSADWVLPHKPTIRPTQGGERQSILRRLRLGDVGISDKLRHLSMEIDWDTEPGLLLTTDLDCLPGHVGVEVVQLAKELSRQASKLGVEPIGLAIALLAHCASTWSRSAARIARALLNGCDQYELGTVLGELKLQPYTDGPQIA